MGIKEYRNGGVFRNFGFGSIRGVMVNRYLEHVLLYGLLEEI